MFINRPQHLSIRLPVEERVFVAPNPDSLYYLESSIFSGIPEGTLIDWALSDLIRSDSALIDIGANIGVWTISFARSPKVKRVYCWEPQREFYEALIAGVALNHRLYDVSPHNVALGSSLQAAQGHMTLRVPDEAGLGGSLRELPNGRPSRHDEMVEVRTLDSYLGTYGEEWRNQIGLVKIDVEGNELDVLRGGTTALEHMGWPLIIFEAWADEWYASRRQVVFDYLSSIGYRVVPINMFPNECLAEKVR